jgi:hypothetical protein
MKIKEAIEKKVVSCGIDTTKKTERQSDITIFPDTKLSIGNNGNIQNLFQGLNIVICCRHNGTKDDMLKAFEDAKNLLLNAII